MGTAIIPYCAEDTITCLYFYIELGLSTNQCIHRIAELIEDFSFLRQLSAFQILEKKVQSLSEMT